jgi:protein-S-isoprenylcysteine O-methyltransferase Ste14
MLGRIAGGIASLVVFSVVWFWIAGRPDWVQGWALLLAFTGYSGTLVWWVSRKDPELLRERQDAAQNVEPWDQTVIRIYSGLALVLLILSALDSGRHHWSAVPIWVQVVGWGLVGVAAAMIWHVMGVNAYLFSWACLQDDRGQVVVTEGLYRHVRHPMYLGIILVFVGIPLVLASWWALMPGVLIIGVFVYRTAREDGMLMEGLPGYVEYAQKVRYRLVPGVW